MNNKNHEIDSQPWHDLTITPNQFSRLTGMHIHPETLDGAIGWAKDNLGWMSAGKRPDGTLAVPIMHAIKAESRHGYFIEQMVNTLAAEAIAGKHSQESLDEALGLCESLIPDKEGWVDASDLYVFLGETKCFWWWCEHIVYFVKNCDSKDFCFRQSSSTNFHVQDEVESIRAGALGLNESLAFRVALSSPTSRADTLRREYFDLATTLHSVRDFDRITYLSQMHRI